MLKFVAALLSSYRRTVAVYLVVGISQTYVGMWIIANWGRLLDAAGHAHAFADVARPFWANAVLSAVNVVLIWLERGPREALEAGAVQWAKLKAMRKLLRVDFLAAQRMGTGQLVQVVENGADAANRIVTGFWLPLVRSEIPAIVFNLWFLGTYDLRTASAVAAGLVVVLPATFWLVRVLERWQGSLLDRQEEFSHRAVRAFMELVTFRVNRRLAAEITRAGALTEEIVTTRARMGLLQELSYQAFAFLLVIIEVVVIWAQVRAILAGTSTVGRLSAIAAFVAGAFWPVHTLTNMIIDLKVQQVSLRRLLDWLEAPDDANDGRDRPARIGTGAIAFEGVSFAYPDRPVCEALSLTMDGGRITALVGATGGGKTTMVRLALGLLKPSAGRILVDGQDLADVGLDSYYARVAYLPQEAAVFDGTVRENLTFGEPADDARLWDALDRARVKETVNALPAALDAEIGEKGAKLSGGERQRLAIARVLLQDPAIVVMDEPTSALDSVTEELVSEHLRELFRGRTVLLIAHRLQTVREADRIHVVDAGRVVQTGSFDRLSTAPGPFRALWTAQTGTEAGS